MRKALTHFHYSVLDEQLAGLSAVPRLERETKNILPLRHFCSDLQADQTVGDYRVLQLVDALGGRTELLGRQCQLQILGGQSSYP